MSKVQCFYIGRPLAEASQLGNGYGWSWVVEEVVGTNPPNMLLADTMEKLHDQMNCKDL